MKKQILLPLVIIIVSITSAFGQCSTGTTGLGAPGTTIRIDTSPTTVTMTLTAPSNKWIGVGFAGDTMATTTDMFIWNDTPDRDYTVHTVGNSGHNMPTPDVVQSWTMVSDNINSGIRTVVATRPLVSTGDYTFTNGTGFIQIIYALGETTTLAYHGTNLHSSSQISRFILALEEFSLKATSIYPNPSKGVVTIKTNTSLDKITIYSLTGAIVKTIPVESQKEDNEINVSGLAAGTYIFELQNGTEKACKNVVVE